MNKRIIDPLLKSRGFVKDRKDAILPITDVEIENRCGYVFKGSTNRLEYID